MNTAQNSARAALAICLLEIALLLPSAVFAQTSSSQHVPTTASQPLPQSGALDPDCTPIDGGNPDGVPPCGETPPASQETPDGVAHGAGNPIDVITGNKYQRETDLPALPGVLGIEIVRHYNSAQASTDAPLGLLGRGWRLSYETDLYVSGKQLHIVQADGARLVFSPDRSQAGRHNHADPARGWVQFIAAGPGQRAAGYRWIWPEGRELIFDALGKLVEIRMPTGEFLSLARGLDGELVKVTDPQGRSLTFEYAPRSSRGFRGVVAITSPLGRFTYAHQNERALPGLSNLVAATHPDGAIRRYHYGADTGEAAPAWPHHLTGISLIAPAAAPRGREAGERRLSTYAYDHVGRAVMSVLGAPRTLDESAQPQPGTGIEQIDLGFVAPDQTVLSNSLGQRTIYRHTRIYGEPRLLEAIGPGCARCGETNVRYQYDKRGRLASITRLDPTGQPLATTTLVRDGAGRLLRRSLQTFIDGRPVPERLLNRYAYTDDSPRPTLIAQPSVVPGHEHRLQFSYNDVGQVTRMVESGFSPLSADNEPIDHRSRATPIERSSTFSYTRINGRSLLTTTDGPLPNGPDGSPADSDISIFEWDATGNHLTALTLPGGRRSTLAHAPVTGVLKGVRNDEGFATHYTYNLRLQPTTVRFEAPGQQPTQTVGFEYDTLGRRVESRNPSAASSNWLQEWDEHGHLRWRASALGVLATFRYDTEGRPLERSRRSASFEQTEALHYDAQGHLASVRDNAGRGRDWHYDARGRLQYTIDTDGLIHPARAEASPRAKDATPPASVRQRQDDFGRIVWRNSPDSGTVLLEYDAFDRLIAMRDARGNHARYDYDVLGRIRHQRITDAHSGAVEETQWRYEGRRLIEVIHPTQRERYEYDARGLRTARILSLPTEHGERTTVTRYTHDERGQLVATTLPDGSRLRYVRNGQGQVVALKRDTVDTPWSVWPTGGQIIAEGFERDLAGLRSYVTGNGIHTLYQRSREGVLARVVHRRVSLPRLDTAATPPMELLGRSTREIAERLLGIAPAQAQTKDAGAKVALDTTGTQAESPVPPGALGLADEPAALLDHRYLWDVRGNLLHTRQHAAADGAQPTATGHAYDRHGRLLTSVRWQGDDQAPTEEAVWRFAYDATQRRVLSQQGAGSQQDLSTGTQAAGFEPGTHRLADPSAAAHYTASGQPERLGDREYDWDARGRLVEVREHGAVLARYRYDHRDLRNTREVSDRTMHTVYDEHRQPLAELDADGRILRQYVWLADIPLAVIDTPQGVTPAQHKDTGTMQFADKLVRMIRAAFMQSERIVWLHGNHLGAPELATDATGQVLWRATYAPFGVATIQSRDFTLDLRLPGQVFDAETGLHYNRARYYDPAAGQYLTPDPLGTPDGPNPYAYAAFNPLRYVDPDGLILFAFDGTGNSDDLNDPAMDGNSLSNVVHFARAYDSGNDRYVSGVGTVHRDIKYGHIRPEDYATHTFLWWLTPGDPTYVNDMGGNYSGPARIDRMMRYLRDEADLFEDEQVMDIDIIGFSRGAAQARDFANRIVPDAIKYGGRTYYKYTKADGTAGCQPVSFRFMGLFDTVLSTNFSGTGYKRSIPDEFAYVAQAVALNEHRSGAVGEYAYRNPKPHSMHWGGFPLESIGASSNTPGRIRIERGFVGAHADIGGSYPDDEQGLSLVALNWMVEQASFAGVSMKTIDPIPSHNVVLHDQSNVIQAGNPQNTVPRKLIGGDLAWIDYVFPEDREVRGATSGNRQRNMGFDNGSMTHADTHEVITWQPRDVGELGTGSALDPRELGNLTGTVNMQAYLQWLCTHDYFDRKSTRCAPAGPNP
ncbi:RHS repeat-associated core domain-containing protein [Thauera sp. ZXT1-4]|uniref:RHS repeat-associated core domain-containing protein n=1 Tax=Thauera sp. ZXT1-4 TaxID=3460294 RepID=UPI004040B007